MPKNTYKYQEKFAFELSVAWLEGKKESVRTKIRALISKEQIAYVSATVALMICAEYGSIEAMDFCKFIHPNNS